METMETTAKKTATIAMTVLKTPEMTTATSPTATKLVELMSQSRSPPNTNPSPPIQHLSQPRPRSLSRPRRPRSLNRPRRPRNRNLSRPRRPRNLSQPRRRNLSRPRLPQTTTMAATMAATPASTAKSIQVASLPSMNKTAAKVHVAATTRTTSLSLL